MEYLYCKDDNFQDFASGRVLYGGKGIPNFPIRLLLEIYGRALERSNKKEDLVIYDPCCGGGYSLTILGYFQNKYIRKIYGSDIDEDMVAHAKKNISIGLLVMIIPCMIITCAVNRQFTFLAGFVRSYIFLNVFSLFDALVIDSIWFCHSNWGHSRNGGYDRGIS